MYRESVGKHFVVFVEPLHDVQGFLGREAKPQVGVPLQFCQVIEPWGKCFSGGSLYVCDGERLAL